MGARFLLAAFAAVALSVTPFSSAFGFRANWSPPRVWDRDNDNIPGEFGDSQVQYSRGGGDWDAMKTNRLTEALASWAANTDWNPSHSANDSTLQKVYVDGTEPIQFSDCTANSNEWSDIPNAFAIQCDNRQLHGTLGSGDEWYEMLDSDIYTNRNGFSWSFGVQQNAFVSFRGVMTHELGHGASLPHTPDCTDGNQIETMCNSGQISDTWLVYSLTTDDKISANNVYLP